MHQESDEKRIKELFREMRESDERLAPPFRRVYESALLRTEEKRHTRPFIRYGFATVLLVLLIISVMMRTREAPFQSGESAVSLTNWKSPTVLLLVFPGSDLEESPVRSRLARRLTGTTVVVSSRQTRTACLMQSPGKGQWRRIPKLTGKTMRTTRQSL